MKIDKKSAHNVIIAQEIYEKNLTSKSTFMYNSGTIISAFL